jgi:hypothetical protein
MSASGGRPENIYSRRVFRLLTHSESWMFGRIFGLDGRESYRKLRLFRYVALTVKAEVLRAGS